MRHDWIADILAVIDSGSFARAAEARNITQSAFTRRIDAIEAQLGGSLFDRRRKPVALRPGAQALERSLRTALQVQSSLLQEASEVATGSRSITLACQHAISATVSPGIVRTLSGVGLEPVRIRSGNRDECLVMLLSGKADLVISHAVPGAGPEACGFEECSIGSDILIPLAHPALGRRADGRLPVVAYPADVFLGALVAGLWRELPEDVVLHRRAETSLTLAAYRYAVEGLAVAWLPRALAAEDMRAGRLVRVEGVGPDLALDIRMIRLAGSGREGARRGWDAIVAAGTPLSEGVP
ncbi:LysR family transcriptional regulator [Roseibacterium sp. SDUM158017]|uniref:LysR family transcriptional regulator n=1 Tax=Roseicyclus salinarum TaxID=3036773 RepID=UPI002414E9BA|nr:LysR family transcriptional regulator [Roseibacterium sp. SDUM158017]MDG4647505.1 LysR family transcriptional regulator [Roseibacterium sp. SDUM158017]